MPDIATFTPDNPEDFEQMIREIVRDELKKAIAEKVGGLTKFALGLVAKSAISSMATKTPAKPKPDVTYTDKKPDLAKMIQDAIAKRTAEAQEDTEDGS